MIKTYYTNISNITLSEENLNKVYKDRRKKIEKFAREHNKKQSLGAGLMLAKFFPGEEIKIGKYGKPYIENGFEFNLAHSGNYVLLSISGDCPVGCDIEEKEDMDYQKTGKVVFHKNELEKIRTSSDPQDTFFEYWTKKEAFIKCLGTGFHFKTKKLDLSQKGMSVSYNDESYFFKEYMLYGYKIMLCSKADSFMNKMEEVNFT